MLAPRKKLWSTPSNVLDVVCQWIQLKPGDVVCDIGCGDGRVLLHLAAHWTAAAKESTTSVSFLGLDINPERVEEASVALSLAKKDGRIHPQLSVVFHCANAMEEVELYQNATHFFLYLIPRGLKIFKPMLLEVLKNKRRQQQSNDGDNNSGCMDFLTVLTYMSPLPGEKFNKKEVCQVEHQPGAAWPVFLYHLRNSPIAEKQDDNL